MSGNITPKKLRTYEQYIQDLSCIEQLNLKAYKGIKTTSCLNLLKFYHITNPGLPPCLAHDMYEGVASKDFQEMINDLVSKKWFSYNYVNFKIRNIKFFGKQYLNLPPIKKRQRLTGSASEIMKLILIFPFAVLDKIVDDCDLTWTMILTLREICCILNSPKLSLNHIGYLKTLLEEYVELRKLVFPSLKFTPKHHYLLHYPELIRLFGPLKNVWTLRFESKHRYFKSLVHHTYNYKNLTKMLSFRHQYLQSLHFSEGKLFDDSVVADFVEKYTPDHYNAYCTNMVNNSNSKFIFVSDEAQFRGITYKCNMHICFSRDSYDNLAIIKITKILINDKYSD